MGTFLIEQVKHGENDGGDACGPIGGAICVSVHFKKDNEPSRWIELDDVDGIYQFYLSDTDMFDFHANFNSYDDEDEIKKFNENFIEEFEGITLSDNYIEMFDQINGSQKANPASALIKYMILLVRCSDYKIDDLIDMATGKYIDEIDIPVGDDEQDYLSEFE